MTNQQINSIFWIKKIQKLNKQRFWIPNSPIPPPTQHPRGWSSGATEGTHFFGDVSRHKAGPQKTGAFQASKGNGKASLNILNFVESFFENSWRLFKIFLLEKSYSSFFMIIHLCWSIHLKMNRMNRWIDPNHLCRNESWSLTLEPRHKLWVGAAGEDRNVLPLQRILPIACHVDTMDHRSRWVRWFIHIGKTKSCRCCKRFVSTTEIETKPRSPAMCLHWKAPRNSFPAHDAAVGPCHPPGTKNLLIKKVVENLEDLKRKRNVTDSFGPKSEKIW